MALSVTIVHIFVVKDPESVDLAARFVTTYHNNPALYPHDTIVVTNGGKANAVAQCLYASCQNVSFMEHDDSGWDIGGYQMAARNCQSDLMMFFGGTAFFKVPGWLKLMVEAREKFGPGQYGTMGNRGIKLMPRRSDVMPHVRTTGFMMDRELFNQYPMRVTIHPQRYEFEHGANCMTSWLKSKGIKTRVVAANGVYEWEHWDLIPNGYMRGDQSAMLVGDKLTLPPFYTPKARETYRPVLPLPAVPGRATKTVTPRL